MLPAAFGRKKGHFVQLGIGCYVEFGSAGTGGRYADDGQQYQKQHGCDDNGSVIFF
jgi:hypothetical protein